MVAFSMIEVCEAHLKSAERQMCDHFLVREFISISALDDAWHTLKASGCKY